ncbi:efflux RND transporter permease subunit, partial [Klebsiella pneumoniae]|uniref:efflux RND transporter permease subunit n=2 Tax=Pseudomonadota TaxID=1224 RepID=UPI001954EDC1
LMTTAAMALGVIPLITATGAGAAARYSIGLVIFSGILVGTIFTLFVVPMFYTFISHRDHAAEPTAAPEPNGDAQFGRT